MTGSIETRGQCVRDKPGSFFIEISCMEPQHGTWTLTGHLESLEGSAFKSQTFNINLNIGHFLRLVSVIN